MTLSTTAIRPLSGDASPVLDRDDMRTAKDDILPDHTSPSDLGTSHLFSVSDATTRENMMTCWSVKPPHARRRHTSTATLSGDLQRWKTGKATWDSGLVTSALAMSSLLLLTDRARCPVRTWTGARICLVRRCPGSGSTPRARSSQRQHRRTIVQQDHTAAQ